MNASLARARRNQQGFILPLTLTLIVLVSIIAAAIMTANRQVLKSTEQWKESDECLLAAQAVLEQAKFDIFEQFRAFFINTEIRGAAFAWFNNWSAQAIGTNTSVNLAATPYTKYSRYTNVQVAVSIVALSNGVGVGENPLSYVTLQAVATSPHGQRTIREQVCYYLDRSRIFNYIYFLNNFGWYTGVNMVMNGDIRSNFNMQLAAAALVVNGNIYSGANTTGNVWTNWSVATYQNYAFKTNCRPTNPTSATNGLPWKMGYDPNEAKVYSQVGQVRMPYLGDLGLYTNYARITQGKILKGTNVLVNQVYGMDQPGPSGNTNQPDRGCLILSGTSNSPIVITGCVVVAGDVIIKGYFTGQGVVYAGRNIHIVSNVLAMNRPKWKRNDTDPNTTVELNRSKDMLGLAAKGNVIMGNVTDSSWLSSEQAYIKPTFTAEYPTHPTDSNIGYSTSMRGGTNYFNGNYTSWDGGYQVNNNSTGTPVKRAFWQTCVASNTIRAQCATNSFAASKIKQIDAVIYNNHLIAGFFQDAPIMNGGIVARDEAMFVSGQCHWNWDIRLGDQANDGTTTAFLLPPDLAPFETVSWREAAAP